MYKFLVPSDPPIFATLTKKDAIDIQISCIQNIAQAFCRFTAKEDQTKEGYVMIVLVTGRPTPIFLRRVPS